MSGRPVLRLNGGRRIRSESLNAYRHDEHTQHTTFVIDSKNLMRLVRGAKACSAVDIYLGNRRLDLTSDQTSLVREIEQKHHVRFHFMGRSGPP